MHSAIYQGNLRHRRFHPKRHEFSYSLTLFYVDLDELPQLFEGVRGWSLNRANFGTFRRSDFLGDPEIPLIDAVRAEVNKLLQTSEHNASQCPDGPVRMLTNLRILGFCFNPVTLYYLFNRQSDRPSMILAQVNNTPWNERHSYIVKCDEKTGKADSRFDKEFHVSPFNPLDMEYRWVSSAPGEHVLVHMENHSRNFGQASQLEHYAGCYMDATLRLQRKPWSNVLLQKILWQQPWAAVKVPLAIYWQAARLFIKGVPVYAHQSGSPVPAATTTEFKTTGE